MMSENTHLPVELWDNIIDHMWDDHDSLAACSLVCRAWLPSARIHLFHTVRLQRLARPKEDHTEKLEALHRICPFIRTLKFSAPGSVIVDDRLLPHFHAMSRVNTVALQLGDGGVSKMHRPFKDYLSRLPPSFIQSIKKLKIQHIFLPAVDFAQLLSVFPHISALDIFVTFMDDQMPVANFLSPYTSPLLPSDPPLDMIITQLTHRCVQTQHAAHVLTWLSKETRGRCLHTFRLLVDTIEHGGPPDYSPILRQMGTNLQHLWLTHIDRSQMAGFTRTF